MAVPFDVVQSSTEFTGENTLLFPWQPQEEGCCHSGQAPGLQGRTWRTQGQRHRPIFQHFRNAKWRQHLYFIYLTFRFCSGAGVCILSDTGASGGNAATKRWHKVKFNYKTGSWIPKMESCKKNYIWLDYGLIHACLRLEDTESSKDLPQMTQHFPYFRNYRTATVTFKGLGQTQEMDI